MSTSCHYAHIAIEEKEQKDLPFIPPLPQEPRSIQECMTDAFFKTSERIDQHEVDGYTKFVMRQAVSIYEMELCRALHGKTL
jgi:hypothetical protein